MHRTLKIRRWRKKSLSSFSLVELITVIAIMAILAGLVVSVGGGVMQKASRSRAAAEIVAMSSALESYKIENGIYPYSTNLFGPPTRGYDLSPSGTGGKYQTTSQGLYQALSGKTNFLDDPVAGVKSYMPFKANQLGSTKTAKGTAIGTTSTYIQDPWGYSYGYSSAGTNSTYYPYNGAGFFDLWSTGGLLADKSATVFATNSWVNNWSGN